MTPDDYTALITALRLAGGSVRIHKGKSSRYGARLVRYAIYVRDLDEAVVRRVAESMMDEPYLVKPGGGFLPNGAWENGVVLVTLADEGDIPPELIEKLNQGSK